MNFDINKILWPTDFSEPSLETLPLALEIAGRFDAVVWATHIIDPPPKNSEWADASKYYVPLVLEEEESREKTNIEKLLAQHATDKIKTRALVLIGDVADTIVKMAQQEAMDLIVISTHGRSGIKRLVFGSVAEKVVREATCPVLTVRPSTQEQDSQHDNTQP